MIGGLVRFWQHQEQRLGIVVQFTGVTPENAAVPPDGQSGRLEFLSPHVAGSTQTG